MRFNVQYLSDAKGKPKAVQVPYNQWKSLLEKLAEHEFADKFSEDLKAAITDVQLMQSGAKPKRTIQDMINQL